MSTISENLQRIISKIKSPTKLLVVSKTRPAVMIRDAYNLGQRDFGENKVQELLEKSEALYDLDINWHFIGKLQANKINQLLSVEGLVSIHSIDSIKLLNKVISKKVGNNIGVFLQVNTSGESEKGGFTSLADVQDGVEILSTSQTFRLQGLMTIGQIRTEEFELAAKKCFKKLGEYKQRLDKVNGLELELSMGMSQDFEIAQEFGSNWIRIGSDIFGSRE